MKKRNQLVNLPKGEYMCFIDDDDQFSLPNISLAIRFRKWLNNLEMPRPLAFFNYFKWFRKLCGGNWYYILYHTESLYTFKCWGRWEGGFRSSLLKTETYSLEKYMPSFPFNWLAKLNWFRQFCGGTWYYNRYWWDMGRECMFVWERHDTGNIGGPSCTIKKETF